MDATANPSSVRMELNQKFEALPIFKRDRVTALYHFCAALEVNTNPYTVDPDLVMAMGRRALEASMRPIPAIYRNCPAVPVASQIQFNPAAFAEAMEPVEFAFRCDQIVYCFELADRGQFEVRNDLLQQRTIFTYASGDESAADTSLRMVVVGGMFPVIPGVIVGAFAAVFFDTIDCNLAQFSKANRCWNHRDGWSNGCIDRNRNELHPRAP